MDPELRRRLVDRYRCGQAEVVSSLDAITAEELDRCHPGEWSAREVVHHLADSETTSYVRLRKLIAEDDAVIHGYDEELFSRRLHYDRPIDADLALLEAVRRSSAELLDSLSEAEWSKVGTHTDSGTYSVHVWLEIYAAHAHDHADQIRRARRGER